MPLGKLEGRNEERNLNKMFKTISNIFKVIFIIPIIIIIVIILIPVLIIISILLKIDRIKDKRNLNRLIESNNGKIFFVYADYNNYNFLDSFKNIECVKVNHGRDNGLFSNYLTKNCISKCYPCLIKIDNSCLISKNHYNSFKRLYKKENDIDSFLNLIDKSIANLKKEKAD